MIFCVVILITCALVANGAEAPISNSDGPESDLPRKPNIVFILADDLGYNDVPWHNKEVVAPNLKKLADEGIILEQSYVQPICSPTRSALLSGVYPFTIGRQGDVIWPLMPTGLTLNATIIPQYLKPLGYDTHAVGKWHLGFCNWDYTPTERGFDSFKGYYTGSEDYYTHIRNDMTDTLGYRGQTLDEVLSVVNDINFNEDDHNNSESFRQSIGDGFDFRSNKTPDFDVYGNYSTYVFASHVEDILNSSNPEVPQFIYMAFQSVHSPLQVPKNYTIPYMHIKNHNRRTYLGMVTAMDEAVGRIVEALKKSNRYNDTVIIFSTDNGGPTITGGNNWPLRGNKTTLWEGGTRGAAFVHSPLLPNAGSVSHNLFHATDWLATLVAIAGGTPPNETDGVNQWEALKGNSTPPRKEIIYDIDDHAFRYTEIGFQAGIRYGNYKLLVGNPGPGEWTPPPEVEVTVFHEHTSVFITELFVESDTWEFEDHAKLIKTMKVKCKNLKCIQDVLSKYKNINKNKTYNNLTLWEKFMEVVKNYADAFRKWMKKAKHSTETTRDYESNESKNSSRREALNPNTEDNDNFNLSITDITSVDQLLMSPLAFRLYNLKDDPQERKNLAASQPSVVITLLTRLLAYKDRYVSPDTPEIDPRGESKFWGGVWSPGWC